MFVQRRSATRRVFPGIWDIVGGHLEVGETFNEGLATEIKEETGWDLRHVGVQIAAWEWEHGGVVRREFDYLVEVEGDLTSPHLEETKHDAYAWVGLDNLELMMEGRRDGDCRLRDIIGRVLQLEESAGSSTAGARRRAMSSAIAITRSTDGQTPRRRSASKKS